MAYDATDKIDTYLDSVESYILSVTETELTYKKQPDKWSKKEILGHLVDSGINNLQRFTEVQFEKQPYQIRPYNQDALVKANDYQNKDVKEILDLLRSINQQIKRVIYLQKNSATEYQVLIGDKIHSSDYLVKSYVDHFKHHVDQMMM